MLFDVIIMRVAMTIFGSTISPLFDAAQRVLLVDIEEGEVKKRFEASIGELDLTERLWVLTHHKVQVLICGAISSFMHHALRERGIQVYPWIAGEQEEVLHCLALRFEAESRGDRSFRIAVAADGSDSAAKVGQSFRVCRQFLLFDESGTRVGEINKSSAFAPAKGGYCKVAKMLIDARVQVLLIQRCGPNALGMLAAAGIQTILGVKGAVQEAVVSFLQGDRPEPESDGAIVSLNQHLHQGQAQPQATDENKGSGEGSGFNSPDNSGDK